MIDDQELNLKYQELRQDSNIIDSGLKDEFTKNHNFSKELINEGESINKILSLNLNNQSNVNSITGLEKELNDIDLKHSKSESILI